MGGEDQPGFESSYHSHNDLSVISFSMEYPEAMERGRNFRLLAEEELPELFVFLDRYLPESLKVRAIMFEICRFARKFTSISKRRVATNTISRTLNG